MVLERSRRRKQGIRKKKSDGKRRLRRLQASWINTEDKRKKKNESMETTSTRKIQLRKNRLSLR